MPRPSTKPRPGGKPTSRPPDNRPSFKPKGRAVTAPPDPIPDYVRRSTQAGGVPLHVEDLSVLHEVACLVTPATHSAAAMGTAL
jgi:hypothetical protein